MEKDLAPRVQEAGCSPESVWTGAKNLAHTWIRSPVDPTCTSRYTEYTIPTLEKLVRPIHLTPPPHAFMACFRVKIHYLYLYNIVPV